MPDNGMGYFFSKYATIIYHQLIIVLKDVP